VRSNAGCYRPFTVKAPEGSILNCTKPASVNLRTRVGWYIAPNILRALADAAPAQIQAATGLPVAINIYGRDLRAEEVVTPRGWPEWKPTVQVGFHCRRQSAYGSMRKCASVGFPARPLAIAVGCTGSCSPGIGIESAPREAP
jgi:hypothetical protein